MFCISFLREVKAMDYGLLPLARRSMLQQSDVGNVRPTRGCFPPCQGEALLSIMWLNCQPDW